MPREIFEVKRERFNLRNSRLYILQGTWPRDCEAEVVWGNDVLSADLEDWENSSALERFRNLDHAEARSITLTVHLPERMEKENTLRIYYRKNDKRVLWFKISGKELLKKQKTPQYFIETLERDIRGRSCCIRGWAAAETPVSIAVENGEGKPVPCEIMRMERADVNGIYFEGSIGDKAGFYIEVHGLEEHEFNIKFTAGKNENALTVHMARGQVLKENLQSYWAKIVRYTKTHGFFSLFGKGMRKLSGKDRDILYKDWLPKHLPDSRMLEKQRNTVFDEQPRFSIVVPLYKTREKYLCSLIESVRQQTYGLWELCLSDGSGPDAPLSGLLSRLEMEDSRIHVVRHEKTLRISENTNAAIEAATGDYVVFVDHDDELTPNALFECVRTINEHPGAEVIYSDEDKMTVDGKKFFQPHMKPDFNLDLLRTVNYICHLFVVKRQLIQKVGLLRPEYDGAQDYDFIFRCIESTQSIYHIPKILYHWRSHEDSTAEKPESKLYAFEAGQRVVQAHYDRVGISAKVYRGEHLGLYRTKFLRSYDPLISILIPNKDHIEDLKRCIHSIEEKSSYRNYEYIIIENNSEKEETFQYYRQLEADNPKVHVVYWKEGFNYSAINNFGASYAKGEYLLLLNNDTEIINADCLEELLGYCMRKDVGAVGARLYYEDDTIQHAGVVIGFGGIAGHCFVQQPRGETGYCHRIICAQDYSAVTAACMLVDRKVYEMVGGLSTELAVAFNDVDLCMKIRNAGYLIVYNPYAELYHYESKSRGLEDTPEKVARFNREIEIFEKRWPEILKNGDPYYNPNLTLESQNFSLKRI